MTRDSEAFDGDIEERERALSYLLLVELLAFQFASPVRWIETQDVLFSGKDVRRVIEIGPSDTLVAMAKKTLGSAKHKLHDTACNITRDVLSYASDEATILSGRKTATNTPSTKPSPKSQSPASVTRHTEPVKKAAGLEPSARPYIPNSTEPAAVVDVIASKLSISPVGGGHTHVETQVSAAAIVDVPVKVNDIVLAIIAQKLKKPLGDVTSSKSVKQLAGGRSTLENEIIGDLSAEFGSLPERPEDLDLNELCDKIQSSAFSGQLGSISSSLISRFVSSKMPGGFGMNQTREYLKQRWGLGTGRQDAAMIRAAADAPPQRHTSQTEAQSYLDSVVGQYIAENNITAHLSMTLETIPDGASTTRSVDPQLLALATKEESAHKLAQIKLRAKQLGIVLRAGNKLFDELQGTSKQLEQDLASLKDELGEEYISGIQPAWAPRKIRKYDSQWNWALEDLATDCFAILSGRALHTDIQVCHRALLIAGRSHPRLLQILRALSDRLSFMHSDFIEETRSYLSLVRDACESNALSKLGPYISNPLLFDAAPCTEVLPDGQIHCTQVQRNGAMHCTAYTFKSKDATGGWTLDAKLTAEYDTIVRHFDQSEVTFNGKNVLLLGAGPASIGAEILRGLLIAGARVIVTTSSFSPNTAAYYRGLYRDFGSTGSELIVVPFNQASQQDVDALVSYIYDSLNNGLGIDLDHVIPFAAISQVGKDIGEIDSKAELAQRVLLTNVIRLLGAIKKRKERLEYDTRMTQVVLPLSPNHGSFGNDGLYAESKVALEALFEKWRSENWSSYLSLCGANIGWTRGTGLMQGNDIVAAGIELHGVRTFSQSEMAYYILVLMSRRISEYNDTVPIMADFTGGLDRVPDLCKVLSQVRANITEQSNIQKALAAEEKFETGILKTEKEDENTIAPMVYPRARLELQHPQIPLDNSELQQLRTKLHGMVDLDRIVVITGFGELGPWGNARTRWEMEAYGRFSLEACVEMAWIMGMIKHHNGPLDGKHYTGWVDTKTSKAVRDFDIKPTYEQRILDSSGIRFVEPELDIGWGKDPTKRQLLQEIVLAEDLPAIIASREVAQQYKGEHGDNVEIWEVESSKDEMHVEFKKGSTFMVPKALQQEHAVAGQIPTGWDPHTYGIPEDIISQVDRVTLFALVSTAEALLSSGITDAYEFYQYIHVSELGNCIGSGLGGIHALKSIFRKRFHDQPVQNDVLQETFINTTAAWVNMLMISAAGPLRTPVGACATALESLDSGFDLIVSGKAKVCLVGAVDDLDQDISVEFGNMRATVNVTEELAAGRTPREMSRPTSSSRAGFVESHGSGVQVLTTAHLALDMGLPIHAIIAHVTTASDKAGRSVPAPGQGLLTAAREEKPRFPSPLLDIAYRRRRLHQRRKEVQDAHALEMSYLDEELAQGSRWSMAERGGLTQDVAQRKEWLDADAARQLKEALGTFGHRFWDGNAEIAPIRGALAVWGLGIDDLDIASFHGTSTVKNDINESSVINTQLEHLGRQPGNPIFGIAQKWLTGHCKGAAAAWMLNGCLQALDSGLVPGNANADNIDIKLAEHEHVFYPSRTIHTAGGLKAFSITSFGFGQKGAQAIGVHPRYLFASISAEELEEYRGKAEKRRKAASMFFHRGMARNEMVRVKDGSPYEAGKEKETYLDPGARVVRGEVEGGGFKFVAGRK